MKRICACVAVAVLIGAFAIPGSALAANASPCQGSFMSQATLELPPGYWAEGPHANSMTFVDLSAGTADTWGPFDFTVSGTAELYRGQVLVAAGLFTANWEWIPDQTINPAQDTVLWAGWAFGPGDYPSMPAAYADLADAPILFSWDGGDSVVARQGPYTSFCALNGQAKFRRTWGPVGRP